MSDDFADLFDPARRRPAPPSGLPPRELAVTLPPSWRDAEKRKRAQEREQEQAAAMQPPAASAAPRHSADEPAEQHPVTVVGEWTTGQERAQGMYAGANFEVYDEVPDSEEVEASPRRRRWGRRGGSSTVTEKSSGAVRKRRQADVKAASDYQVVSGRRALKPQMTGTLGHVTFSKTEAIAWFVQPPGAWTMRENARQRQMIDTEARVMARLADLGVEQLHRRTVRTTWPVQQWARQHNNWAYGRDPHADAGEPGSQELSSPLPDVAGALSWDEYLAGQQTALLYEHPTVKLRFWGIYLPTRPASSRMVERAAAATGERHGFGAFAWLRRFADSVADTELQSRREYLAEIERVMAASGFGARPAQPGQLDYLLRRSASLGLPLEAPPSRSAGTAGDWSVNDVAALADLADLAIVPGDDYVQVSGTVNGRRHSGFVIVVTIGRMGALPIPERMLPWQVLGDGVDATLEWSERVRLLDAGEARKVMQRQADKIKAQFDHYTVEHDEDPPQALREQYQMSKQVIEEADHDHTGFVTRVHGWWRIAVVGSSPEEVRNKVARLREVYEPTIELHVEHGQVQLLREFLPCEPQANTAHQRRMPVRTAASGMAAVGDRVGDRTGIILGRTASIAARPVAWNAFAAMEDPLIQKSGLTPIVGGLGSGKTFMAAICVYQMVRAGAHGVILDPSGPLSRLKLIPELTPFTRVYELTGARSQPGALNPYHVIRDPNPDDWDYNPDNDENFGTEPDWDSRVAAARNRLAADRHAAESERISTVVTVFRMMLTPQTRGLRTTNQVLQRAATKVGGSIDHSALEPLEMIGRYAQERHSESVSEEFREAARAIFDELEAMRQLPSARVLFPPSGSTGRVPQAHGSDRLTILTMPGLQLPSDRIPEEQWSPEQRMAGPLMHLAAWLANRMIYDMPRWVRKVLFLDENKYLKETGAGATLNQRINRDTRKFNVRAFVGSQLADDFLGLTDGGDDQSALAYEVFVGDVGSSETAIAGALKLLGLPVGQGYEAVLRGIGGSEDQTHDEDVRASRRQGDRPRQFVVKMGDDIELITADWSNFTHLAHVFDILRSDPTASRTAHPTPRGVA
ncbi:ATP-binding protein [Gordonia amicalis]|uniref:ATP-binding protein n=1 Tax=Gordonia amicalis TaxID=89053 RepID=A0ABU4DJX0_9ACTN|nr:ATP-binding protein [Gordonia amicalis]MDV6310049.1 ATP-binding protein [Gordonia amicalis]